MRLQWFGGAGHFIAADSCRYHLHTHVNGKWCVSTVGDYHPKIRLRPTPPGGPDLAEEIGLGRLYETMVFELFDGNTNGHNLDFEAYNDRGSADVGHDLMLRKWAGIAEAPKEADSDE